MRAMNLVRIGSFAAPRVSASRASSGVTPSISNMMRPGATRATQYSGAPLPEPMRTSAGLVETGTSGKMRIHTRPARFIARVIARRADSICRAVMRSGSRAFRPKVPKFSVVPPLDKPWMRPLCCLRYFVRFGESIVLFHLPLRRLLGRPAVLRHRVVRQDLALEHPHLHAAGAIRGLRCGEAVVDVRARRVHRHPTLTIPLNPGDSGAPEAPATVDPDPLGAEPHGRLHRPLHRAAE